MLRVLVVDDSAVARQMIISILESDPEIEVVGEAHDGAQAVDLCLQLRPDIITMDVQMPRLDGFEATREVMRTRPTPIVIVSGSLSRPDMEKSMNALQAGALTVLGKPRSPASPDFEKTARGLRETLKSMAQVHVVRQHRPRTASVQSAPSDVEVPRLNLIRVVAIAASTGGPQAIERLLRNLPADFSIPILLVQHISPGFTDGFIEWLNGSVPLNVRQAADHQRIEAGSVYVAAEDRHLSVQGDRLRVSGGEKVEGFRPSANVLFESVASSHGADAVGVILTGMGRDGVEGLARMHRAGASVIAQDEKTCVVFGMPQAAIEAKVVSWVLPLDEIPVRLSELAATVADE